jgi:hypothetical protein
MSTPSGGNIWSLFPGGKDPLSGAVNSVTTDAVSSVVDTAKTIIKAIPWARIAEVILGLVLVGVGLSKLTNAVPAATKLAKMVS